MRRGADESSSLALQKASFPSSMSLLTEAGHREVKAMSLNLGEISHSSSTSRGTSEAVARLEVSGHL